VAHVNYGSRGRDSDADEALVKQACEKLGVRFESKHVKITKSDGGNFEEKARNVRYEFFDHLAAKFSAQWVTVAHTADDQLETIMFNLFRGSGKRGESGMRAVQGNLLRPMLDWSRTGVRSFCKKNKIKFNIDHTNEDTAYSRNKLRLQIIPELQLMFPKFRESFLANAQMVGEEDRFMDETAALLMGQIGATGRKSWSCKKSAWKEISPAIQRRIIRILYKEKFGSLVGIRKSHMDEVLNLLSKAITGKKKKFGKGVWSVTKQSLLFQ